MRFSRPGPSTPACDGWRARASLDEPTSVELLTGTTERRARVAPIGESGIEPGERGFGRIHVDGPPLALLPGDRFVLRGFARDAGVGATLGGGTSSTWPRPIVVDGAPSCSAISSVWRARIRPKRSRSGSNAPDSRASAEAGSPSRPGLDPRALEAALETLVAAGTILCLDDSLCLGIPAADRLMAEMIEALERFHAADPLQAGMPRAVLLGTLPNNVSSEAGSALLARLAGNDEIEISGETVARRGFESTLDADQTRLAEMLGKRLAEAALEPPALRTIAEESGEEIGTLRALAHYLDRQGDLVAAPDELFFDRTAVCELIDRVLAHFDAHDELDTQPSRP